MTIGFPEPGAVGFSGRRRDVFRLALITAGLTVITAGIYRFWQTTRLRRHYWSAIRPGGFGFDYTGDPVEKLIGFLGAVVLMSVWLGLVNLAFAFLSLTLFQSLAGGTAASFAVLVPVFFAARYRARRYRLARTAWRGIGFEAEPAAWGYCWRGSLHLLATLLTLGLWWPVMRFQLERFYIDRTRWGDLHLRLGGPWWCLYPPFLPALTVLVASSALALVFARTEDPRWGAALGVSVVLAGICLLYWHAAATRRVLNRVEGGEVGLVSSLNPWRITWIRVSGGVVTGAGTLAILAPAGAMIGAISAATLGTTDPMKIFAGQTLFTLLPALVAYFLAFIAFFALRHAFVTLPVWRHTARTLRIQNVAALSRVSQSHGIAPREAEGVIDALDLGGGI